MVDDFGRPVRLRGVPGRVVSLAPNLSEILVAAGAQSKIVGTDDFSNTPAALETLPKVGGVEPSIELITQLSPDIVFSLGGTSHPALARALAPAGIPLYVFRTERLADIPRVMRRAGELLDTAKTAEAAAQRLEQQLQQLRRRRTKPPAVLFAVWLDPLFVAGKDSFVDDLIELSGGTNAVTVPGWPEYSLEALVARPPDLIIVAAGSQRREQLQRFFRQTVPWRDLRAVQSGFWYVVDEDRFSRPGPRVAEAAADLNEILDQWEQKQ